MNGLKHKLEIKYTFQERIEYIMNYLPIIIKMNNGVNLDISEVSVCYKSIFKEIFTEKEYNKIKMATLTDKNGNKYSCIQLDAYDNKTKKEKQFYYLFNKDENKYETKSIQEIKNMGVNIRFMGGEPIKGIK